MSRCDGDSAFRPACIVVQRGSIPRSLCGKTMCSVRRQDLSCIGGHIFSNCFCKVFAEHWKLCPAYFAPGRSLGPESSKTLTRRDLVGRVCRRHPFFRATNLTSMTRRQYSASSSWRNLPFLINSDACGQYECFFLGDDEGRNVRPGM